MSDGSSPMHCPKCGSTMNLHAEKLLDPRNRSDQVVMNSTLRGIVYEIFACPACGASAWRVEA